MSRRPRDEDVVDVDSELTTPVAAGPAKKRAPAAAKKLVQATLTPIAALPDGVAPVNLRDHLTEASWHAPLNGALRSAHAKAIEHFLAIELAAGKEVFPPMRDVFAAFNFLPFDGVRVVLIGQDPYHDNGQANGLCFSVAPGVKVPPSLVNMYKELTTDIPGFVAPKHGTLTSWARQGILMLNATLTVEAHQANSHAKIGWQAFTDDVIAVLNRSEKPIVFLLWGGFAQKKGKDIDRKRHRVINSAHPSPLSMKAWFGCKTFSQCNDALVELGQKPIDWTLPQDPHSA